MVVENVLRADQTVPSYQCRTAVVLRLYWQSWTDRDRELRPRSDGFVTIMTDRDGLLWSETSAKNDRHSVTWALPNMYPESYDCGLPGHLAVMRAAMMEPGVHTMSDELTLQISCNIFLAFKWILMMTSGNNISHYTTAKLSVHVWNHDLIWWQNKIDTQKHFHKTTITSSWTLSKTKIPITIVKAQMPSNPNQKSRTRDNNACIYHSDIT